MKGLCGFVFALLLVGAIPVQAAPIRLEVDATDIAHRIFHVRETIPLAAGVKRLVYPKSLPGMHGAANDASRIAGLTIRASGKELAWRRTDAWTLELPASVTKREVRVEFDLLTPLVAEQGQVTFSDHILDLQWGSVLLIPERASAAAVDAKLELPEGWSLASALEPATRERNRIAFRRTKVSTLIDSPVMAGDHVQKVELSPGSVSLALFSEAPARLPDEFLAHWKAQILEADALFGRRPFRRYVFLVALSDSLGGLGLEHGASAEIALSESFPEDALSGKSNELDLFAHEYVHAWNGKLRTPLDISGSDTQSQHKSRLLWVYEGLTQYLDWVLAARSALLSPEQIRGLLATRAAELQREAGRRWRPLADIVHDDFSTTLPAKPWPDWQRWIMDLYDAGALLWLDVDVRLRQCTGGQRSLDDFARSFFARPGSYRRADIERALGQLCRADWRAYFRQRVDSIETLDGAGIGSAGWTLAASSEDDPQLRFLHRGGDFRSSAGLVLDDSGRILEVSWQGPAFKAGLRPGLSVSAVASQSFSLEAFSAELGVAAKHGTGLDLTVRDGKAERRVTIAGVKERSWPMLVRKPESRDWLSAILQARRAAQPPSRVGSR